MHGYHAMNYGVSLSPVSVKVVTTYRNFYKDWKRHWIYNPVRTENGPP